MSKQDPSIYEKMYAPHHTGSRYLDRVLVADENVVYIARLHWMTYGFALATMATGALLWRYGDILVDILFGLSAAYYLFFFVKIVSVAIVLSGLFHLFFDILRRHSTDLVVTDQRVIYKRGNVAIRLDQTLLSKISSVNIASTILGRLLGYGTVIIKLSGGEMPPVDHVAQPWRFHYHIMYMLRRMTRLSKGESISYEEAEPEKLAEPVPRKIGQSR